VAILHLWGGILIFILLNWSFSARSSSSLLGNVEGNKVSPALGLIAVLVQESHGALEGGDQDLLVAFEEVHDYAPAYHGHVREERTATWCTRSKLSLVCFASHTFEHSG